MALKTKEPPPPAENALVALGLNDTGLTKAAAEERKQYLPYLKIAWDIEAIKLDVYDKDNNPVLDRNGKPVKEAAAGKLIVSGGESDTKVQIPCLMTVLVARGAARELVTTGDKSKYVRCYDAIKGDHKDEYLKMLARGGLQIVDGALKKSGQAELDAKGAPKVQVGTSYLLAIVNPVESAPTSCVIGLLEAFKTQQGYWSDALRMAQFRDGKGIVIEIEDHAENATAPQSNPTNRYYDKRKFNQWRQVALRGDQMQFINQAVRDRKEACDGWFAR